MLVNFVECLEKQIYNAYEGTAVGLQSVSKVKKTFLLSILLLHF